MAEQTQNQNPVADSTNERSARPIAEFAERGDYPQNTLGELVDIGGVAGTVFEITANSLKVRTPEGSSRSFNYHTLRKLYGPRVLIEPHPVQKAEEPSGAPSAAPLHLEIPEPDFDQPMTSILDFLHQPDFPKSVLGKMVEISGYVGVVVAVENDSLKVRSVNGTSRKYNAQILRKLHEKGN